MPSTACHTGFRLTARTSRTKSLLTPQQYESEPRHATLLVASSIRRDSCSTQTWVRFRSCTDVRTKGLARPGAVFARNGQDFGTNLATAAQSSNVISRAPSNTTARKEGGNEKVRPAPITALGRHSHVVGGRLTQQRARQVHVAHRCVAGLRRRHTPRSRRSRPPP